MEGLISKCDSGQGRCAVYSAQVAGSECVVELSFAEPGLVQGRFISEGEVLELCGRLSGQQIMGFMLEPTSKTPIGVFRTCLSEEGLLLEMDVPDFAEVLERCDLERITLSRVAGLDGLDSSE
jgi:hypothetical protein